MIHPERRSQSMLAGAGLDVESIQLGNRGIVFFFFLFWFALHKELLCFSHQTLPGRKTLYRDTHPVVSDVVRPPCFTAVLENNNGPFNWIHRAFECCFLLTFKRFTSHFRRLYGLRSRLLLTSSRRPQRSIDHTRQPRIRAKRTEQNQNANARNNPSSWGALSGSAASVAGDVLRPKNEHVAHVIIFGATDAHFALNDVARLSSLLCFELLRAQ
jgi:hypothetical protein